MGSANHPSRHISAPTVDQVQAAYESQRRPGWPTFAELAANAARYSLVMGAAQRMARGERIERAPDPVPAPAQSPAHRTPVPHHPPQFDHKRAAAGDRDEA